MKGDGLDPTLKEIWLTVMGGLPPRMASWFAFTKCWGLPKEEREEILQDLLSRKRDNFSVVIPKEYTDWTAEDFKEFEARLTEEQECL